MVIAGRVLIIPKGAWSNLTPYEMLDLVSEGDKAYLARQASVGMRPSEDASMTYWQPFGSSASIATTDTPGLVMPDGVTITVDATGLIVASLNVSDLKDIKITNLANGDILKYDGTQGKWVNVALGTAATRNATSSITSGSTDLIESGAVNSLKQTIETNLGNKVNTSDVANNLTTTAAGKVLDARQGKTLNDSKANTNLLGQKWSSSTSYLVGQYCISGNVLYKCILTNTNHQPPNSTYWKATDVNSELAEIASSSTAQTATVIDDFANNNTEHSVTVDLTQYHHIGCAVKGVSSNTLIGVIDIPISVFKQFGVILSIGPTSNSISLQLKVTYVSDTQIKVKGSNLDSYWGGKVFVY